MLAVIVLLALLLWVPFICRFELAGGDGEETVKKIKLKWLFISHTIDTDAVPKRKPREEVNMQKEVEKRKEEKADIDTDAFPKRKPHKEVNMQKEVEKRKEETAEKEMDISRAFELVRTLHRPAITLVRRMVRSIKIRELSCNATFGLSDPADTGMLAGFLYAASAPIARSNVVSVRLDPVFWDQTFGYRARGSIGITIGRLILPVIIFGCSRPVRAEIVRYIRLG
uniref:DUF2953 domain-containing protein n=1 Tax=Candidatus Methanogaster sp. ANME-2c ERB4 TaxID=2759911 RepID=A0A7G9YGF4_9EURY|nr:hypothetical protein ONOHIMFI_00014 [Methanosarcinales archaeon ANME-2c ERB4]